LSIVIIISVGFFIFLNQKRNNNDFNIVNIDQLAEAEIYDPSFLECGIPSERKKYIDTESGSAIVIVKESQITDSKWKDDWNKYKNAAKENGPFNNNADLTPTELFND